LYILKFNLIDFQSSMHQPYENRAKFGLPHEVVQFVSR